MSENEKPRIKIIIIKPDYFEERKLFPFPITIINQSENTVKKHTIQLRLQYAESSTLKDPITIEIPELRPEQMYHHIHQFLPATSGLCAIFLDEKDSSYSYIKNDEDEITELSFDYLAIKSYSDLLQERLIEALDRAVKSQDRIANIQIILAIIALLWAVAIVFL